MIRVATRPGRNSHGAFEANRELARPFWFDLLSRMAKLRGTGRRPEGAAQSKSIPFGESGQWSRQYQEMTSGVVMM